MTRVLVSLIAALAVIAGATLWRAAAREAAANAAYPPEGRFITVSGTRMHAVVAGSGPDLVLIHGASGSVRDFTFGLVGELSADYRVIAIDRPGFGWSDPIADGDSIAAQAAAVRAVAQSLGADRPLVLGHSYGGAVALAWALDAPEQMAGMILVSAPSYPWGTPPPLLYRLTAPAIGQAVAVPLIAAWTPLAVVTRETGAVFAPQTAPAGYADHFGPAMSLRRDSFALNARQRVTLEPQIEAMVPRYPGLSMPVELVHGTADDTVGLPIHSERLVRAVPGAALDRLEGVGHMPHHIRPDAIVAAIDRAAARAGLR